MSAPLSSLLLSRSKSPPSTTGPIQKIITTEKGIALDFDSVNRNAQAHSKELYTWGQNEAPDVRDSQSTPRSSPIDLLSLTAPFVPMRLQYPIAWRS